MSKEAWESFFSERSHCGYDAYWNQVYICKESVNNDQTLIYSFNTKAFTEATDMFGQAQKSGFVQDRSGHLLWAENVDADTYSNSVITPNYNNSPDYANKTAHANIPDFVGE